MDTENIINPRVSEGYTMDVSHGIGRIDKESMNLLEIKEGDIIEVQGKRKTVAKCLPLYPSDEGENMIRIDGIIRLNAGVEIGDIITIRKIKDKTYPAFEITLKLLEDQDELIEEVKQMDDNHISRCLDGIPIIFNDTIAIRLSHVTETTADVKYAFFQILETYPSGIPIIIDTKTVFDIVDYVFLKQANQHKKEYLEKIKTEWQTGKLSEDEFLDLRNNMDESNHTSTRFKNTTFQTELKPQNQPNSRVSDWVYACLSEAKAIIQKYHTEYDTIAFFQNTTYDLFEQTDKEDAYGYITINPKSNHFSIGLHPILLEKNRQNQRMLVIILVHELLHAIHDRDGWQHDKINPLERKLANLAGYFDALVEMENLAFSGRMRFCNN